MNNYKNALSYAFKLDSNNYRDLVHSAYLSHYDRNNGENLFDRHQGYIMKAIRWYRDYEWRSQQYEFRGERFVYEHQSYSEAYDPNYDSPDLILEKNEAYENLLKQINVFDTREQLIQILTYRVAGFSQKEIANLMGFTVSYISWQMKRLKQLI